MNNINKSIINNKVIYIYFIFVIISFIFGFYLNEDSSGGGKLDFIHEWKSFLEFKKGPLQALTSLNYESSRTPLFLIINSFNFFAIDEYSYRLSNFIFNIIIFICFFLCLKEIKKYELNQTILISSLLLLSPYFRTSSYWAHQENLPYFFFFLTIIFITKFNKNIYFYPITKILTISFLSCLSFYSDQKFIFLSLFTFLFFILKKGFNGYQKTQILIVYIITALPAFYLFYIWDGILPKESLYRLGFYKQNLSASLSIICFYFLPFVFLLRKNLFNFKIFSQLKNYDYINLFIFFIIILFTIPNFNSPWGNGSVVKLFYVLNSKFGINLLILKFLFIIFLVSIGFSVYIILKNRPFNFLPIILVVILSSLVERTYNEYFDPLILVMLFTFFEFNPYFKIDKDKLIIFYIFFYLSFLVFANIYYNYFNLNVV